MTLNERGKSRLRAPADEQLIRALEKVCRDDLLSFGRRGFIHLTPGVLFLPNWHLEAVAFQLEQALLGKTKRLIINLPPRYLKSLLASVAFPAFALGHDPAKRFIVVSCGLDLAAKLGSDTRSILNAPFYKAIFPGTRILRSKNSELEVATTQGGYRLATSIDGSVVGRGADIIIIDDPLTPAAAASDIKRGHVNDWFHASLVSRLNDSNSVIIIVMQRLHVDDLCGHVLKSGDGWIVLSLPAIAEHDESVQIGENRFHFRAAGDALHPERHSTADWEARRFQVGSDTFAAQYQQCPVPLEGAIFKRVWVRTYDQLPPATTSSYVLQSWDTAVKSGGEHDFSACATMLVHGQELYLMHMFRERVGFPTLRERATALAREYHPNRILVEDSAVGSSLAEELRSAGFSAIAVRPQGDKLSRLSIQSAKVESGRFHLPRQAPWLSDFEAEFFAVPNAPHDDQADAVVQAMAYAAERLPLFNATSVENYGRLVQALAFSRLWPG
jgi:predicted phage terminase large subunit-like protein